MSHHAYILINTKPEDLLEFADLPSAGPDVWREEFEMFGVDDAHLLKERQSRHALDVEAGKYFILTIWKISVEAQNALLKTLEEPTAGTKIILIVPTVEMLLPTIRSRCLVIKQTTTLDTLLDVQRPNDSDAAKFLSLDPAGRIKWAENFLIAEPGKERINKLLNDIEIKLAENLTPATAPVLERLATLKSYASDRSPSLRLILEELSFLI